MKSFSLMACVVLALVLAGCDAGTLVDPGSSTASVAASGKANKMVPIKGDATFVADLTVVPPVQDCGYGEVFFRRFNGEGNFSHVGSMTIVIETDACWVNPDDFTLGVSGTYLQTAANGDQLRGTWGGKMYGPNPEGGPNLWDFFAYDADYPVEYTGGTGRFEGVYGHAAGGGTFDRNTLFGTYWFEGVISTVGSLK